VESLDNSQHPVGYEVSGPVVTITIDSPETRNALDEKLAHALAAALCRAERESGIEVLLLNARGRMFCPGADLGWLRPEEPGIEQRVDRVLAVLNPAVVQLRRMPAIVVAAVHGAVAGGGIGLLTMADLVIASANTRFNLAYTKIGATPDLGTTWHLPRLIGERRALELMLLSDEFDAARARELGLVNFVVPAERFDDEVKRLVERIARGSRGAQEAVKRLVHGAASASLDAQLESERREMLAAAVRDEFLAGVLKARAKSSATKTTDAGTDEAGR